jgi:hypothetical protein
MSARARARLSQALVLAAAVVALVFAWRARLEWFERRWSLGSSHAWVATALRLAAVALALVLTFVVCPRLARWVARAGRCEATAWARAAAAVVLALVVSEVVMRVTGLPASRVT